MFSKTRVNVGRQVFFCSSFPIIHRPILDVRQLWIFIEPPEVIFFSLAPINLIDRNFIYSCPIHEAVHGERNLFNKIKWMEIAFNRASERERERDESNRMAWDVYSDGRNTLLWRFVFRRASTMNRPKKPSECRTLYQPLTSLSLSRFFFFQLSYSCVFSIARAAHLLWRILRAVDRPPTFFWLLSPWQVSGKTQIKSFSTFWKR